MIVGFVIPIAMNTDWSSAVLACLLEPFGDFGCDTLLVCLWWIIPVSVNTHGASADITTRLIPSALLVVLGLVVPIFVNPNRVTAVAAGSLEPFSSFPLSAFLVHCGRVVPIAVYAHSATANLAVILIPSAFLAVFRDVVPIFVNGDFRPAVITVNGIPLGHKNVIFPKAAAVKRLPMKLN